MGLLHDTYVLPLLIAEILLFLSVGEGTGRILFPYLDQLIRNGLFLDDGNINIGALQHSNAYVFETGLFIINSKQFLKLTNGPYMNKLSYVSIWFLPSAGRPRTTTFKFQYHFRPFTFF